MRKKFERPDRQQQRTLIRVAVVFAGFLVYRALGDDRLGAGILLWAGIVIAGLPLVDRFTVGPPRAQEMLHTGAILLGLGLCAAGAFLAFR